MKVVEIQNLNTYYNFLMDFIGLAEVYNENGLTENTIDRLDRMQESCFDHLDKEENAELSKHISSMKDIIYKAMDNMESKVKNQLIKL